jgi:malate permease and related proteins
MISQIINVVAPVFICAVIGFIWARKQLPYNTDMVSKLVFNLAAPCLVVSSISKVSLAPAALWQMGLAAVLASSGVLLLGALFIRIYRVPMATYLPALVFPNVGNMGLPLCLFAFGDKGLALAVAYFMVMSVAHFSVGMAIASGERIALRHFFSNPILAAIAVAIILVMTGWHLPLWLNHSVNLIGDMTIPLMLITLGYSLANLKVHQFKQGLYFATLRLVLGGLMALAVAELLNLEGINRGVVILQGIMPMAVFNYLFALKSGRGHEEVASMILVSTLMACVLIPVVLFFVL